MIGCFLDPSTCIDGWIASWLAWFPFGREGFIFFCGMVLGAIVGKIGVAAIGALILAVRVAPGERFEHVDGRDAEPPVRKPKAKPIFRRKP